MRYSKWVFRSVFSFVAIMLAFWASDALALENALRTRTVQNKGAYSAIVTGNPTLRNDPTGKWSYMRVYTQKMINGNTYYVEIGWIKSADPQSNFIPRAYWAYRDVNGFKDFSYVGNPPGIGIGYNYRVAMTAPMTYSFYFNDLNNPVKVQVVGWNKSTTAASGGETPNVNQGMGDSGNNNSKYLGTDGTTWFALCGAADFITNPIYHVDNGANCSSWRVYGNN